MPRCLMAKKWKGYPWADRVADDKSAEDGAVRSNADDEDDEEEIDVVGESPASSHQGTPPTSCWGPSSPTAGATAPSPPPSSTHPGDSSRVAVLYNGYIQDISSFHLSAYLSRTDRSHEGSSSSGYPQQPSYATLQTPAEARQFVSAAAAAAASSTHEVGDTRRTWAELAPHQAPPTPQTAPPPPRNRKSMAMCFTSTGAALSLPPKKKDIYRPYSLEDKEPSHPQEAIVRRAAAEDLRAAHAILDLSASTASMVPSPAQRVDVSQERGGGDADPPTKLGSHDGKTVAYTYEAFFVSDGRSKRKSPLSGVPGGNVVSPPCPLSPVSTAGSDSSRPRYTCPECGKQYATSSNLSRHKQTHRSLDSQSAKKCVTCGKAYVSMPALAMHLLTHKLSHACGVCGKLFSRPWLLQGHLRSHSGEKPFGCAHCGKAFADRSNLRAHMQTHSSDKNYTCTRCHKSFALKSYLNKHLESACFKDGGVGGGVPGTDEAASPDCSGAMQVACPSPSPSFHGTPLTPFN